MSWAPSAASQQAVVTAERAGALDTSALNLLWTGVGRWMLGHNDEAARLARRALDRARQDSALALVPQALRLIAWAEFDRGRWRAAYAAASEGAELASELDQRTTACACLGLLAEVDAATGDDEACSAHAATAIAIARATGLGYYRERAERALGRLELAQGRVAEAIERLEQVQQRLERAGNWEANVTPAWDLVEAYVRAGELEKARALLSRAEEAMPPVSAAEEATIQRCHGIVADEESFEAAFERALELHEAEPFPFEQARTRLAYGERLRRAGERRRARDKLRAALAEFDELGAEAGVRVHDRSSPRQASVCARPRSRVKA